MYDLQSPYAVGGKIDVHPNERQVTQAEAEQHAHKRHLSYFEVSSKENIGVQEVGSITFINSCIISDEDGGWNAT